MNVAQAAEVLSKMYTAGKGSGEAATQVHLFGIRYAEAIRGLPLKEICLQAGIAPSFEREIYKGMKLARHVQEKT